MIRVIHAEIWSNDWTEFNALTQAYSSCVRFAYNRFKKDSLKFNDVRNICKKKYITLNTRQVSDAVLFGQSILKHRK